jgi:hypothetical protein
MRKRIAIAAILGLFAMVPAMAATCPGNVLFQDAFASPNPAFYMASDSYSKVTIAGGKAEISLLQQNASRPMEYSGTRYGDASVCVTVSELATDKADTQNAGVIFWAADYGSYYSFQIRVSGQFDVLQVSPGSSGPVWTFPVGWTDSAAIKKGVGVANTLRVNTKGNTAMLFINDQQVGTITGTPPAGGGSMGLFAGSITGPETWDFTDFSVSFP